LVVLVVLPVVRGVTGVALGVGATVGDGFGGAGTGPPVGTGRGRLLGKVIGTGSGMTGVVAAEAGWKPSGSTTADRVRVGRVASARRVMIMWVPPHRGLRQRSGAARYSAQRTTRHKVTAEGAPRHSLTVTASGCP
jgi:hypothetical protein